MTRVLRDLSKSELERVVEHATRKQLLAEDRYRRLRLAFWRLAGVSALGAFALGLAAGWLAR